MIAYKRYSREFKKEAIALVQEQDYRVMHGERDF